MKRQRGFADLITLLIYAAIAATVVAAYFAWAGHQRQIGRDEVQAKWDAERGRLAAAALVEAQKNAAETARRLKAQEENQNAQDLQLAALRDAAARNAADADRVRNQSAAAARDWSARLADAPTRQDLEAAATAIAVLTDVRGRLDAAAGQLAAYAGAANAAGLKCERDYDALSLKP